MLDHEEPFEGLRHERLLASRAEYERSLDMNRGYAEQKGGRLQVYDHAFLEFEVAGKVDGTVANPRFAGGADQWILPCLESDAVPLRLRDDIGMTDFGAHRLPHRGRSISGPQLLLARGDSFSEHPEAREEVVSRRPERDSEAAI